MPGEGLRDPYEIDENIQYFDGLGRIIQDISICQTYKGNDFIKPYEYDQFGRTTYDFLAFPSENNRGDFVSNPTAQNGEQTLYYKYGTIDDNVPLTDYPYSKTIFDNSPLNKIQEVGFPGLYWQPDISDPNSGHSIKYDYSSEVLPIHRTTTGLFLVDLFSSYDDINLCYITGNYS